MEVFEFLGMIATMSGAFLVSKKNEKLFWYGLCSFIMANYFVFAFASEKGLLPLQIQMVFLFLGGIPSLRVASENWELVKKVLIGATIIYIVLVLSFIDFDIKVLTTTKIEVVAAAMAIIGSYLFRYKNKDIRVLSFILFLLADILYVKISIDNNLLFFGIQSLFFWYTSIKGIKNNLEGDSLSTWFKRISVKTC